MFLYGFELEGFFFDATSGETITPQKGWTYPLDGFPGLCEIRTAGGKPIEKAVSEMFENYIKLNRTCVDFQKFEHKFSGDELAYMRKNFSFNKDNVDVRNIYGSKIRALHGKTLASLQINISNCISSEYKKDNVTIPAQYGLLDVYGIVSRLDREFVFDLKSSNRQPGMYAIKNNVRLEYRSLPNKTWTFHIEEIKRLLSRIEKAVKGE